MSSLKLLHSGGNGVIISAPSSNPSANRTITLNDNYAGDGSFVTANSSDKVGIGTASPSHKLHVVSSDTDTAFFKGRFVRVDGAASSDSPRVNFSLDGTDKTSLMCNRTDSSLNLETLTSAPIKLTTNSTERMRIHSSAYVSFGTTSTNPTSGGSVLEGEYGHLQLSRANTNSEIMIRLNRDGSTRGSIAVSTSTTYNTSSDYRLKENVTNLTDALTRFKKITPRRFNFIDDKDNQLVDGFIAHEVSTAVPEAVTGTKDQVELADDNEKGIKKGDPIYQQLDYSKFVPLLTAALQEEVAKREALEARVAALEGA